MNNVESICNPKSIAVFGVSAREGNWGYEIMKSIISGGYQGRLYPINPKGGKVLGYKLLSGLHEIKDNVDLAIIGLRAEIVPAIVKECREKGVRSALVVSGGFAETGAEGRKLQERLVEMAGDMRIIGPNTMGIADLSHDFNGTIVRPQKGVLGYMGQSGNISNEVMLAAHWRGLGFTQYLDFGNGCDVGVCEILEYTEKQEETRAVLIHLEGLKEGEGSRFIQIAQKVATKKPVIVLKTGNSPLGAQAASSHTGSVAGEDAIFSAAFKQAGILRAETASQMVEMADALVNMPPLKGKKIAILSDGGGHTTMACDFISKFDFALPELSPDTREKLGKILMPHSSLNNPVDFAGALEADLINLPKAAQLVLQDENVDGAMIIGLRLGQYATDAKYEIKAVFELVDVAAKSGKPIVVHNYLPNEQLPVVQMMRSARIPIYTEIGSAVNALAGLLQYNQYLSKGWKRKAAVAKQSPETLGKSLDIMREAQKAGRRTLLEPEARDILKNYGLPAGVYQLAHDEEEAVQAAQKIGFPVVAKIVSPQIIHKSDAGGVKLNLCSDDDVRQAYRDIIANAHKYDPAAQIEGILIAGMEKKGLEIIVGMLRDKQFGPTVMVGMGGIFVEVLKDVAFRVAPLTHDEALTMLRETKCYTLLQGVRGEKTKDVEALVQLLCKISRLAMDLEDIDEIDLNPVFVFEKGLSIVDARFILKGGVI